MMNLPEVPPIFRQTTGGDRGWWWLLLDEDGQEVTDLPDEYAGQRFTNQGDAESWVGEIWADLAHHGVAAVVLYEHERKVYGPMGLSAL